ncbi:Hypothetical protein NTJ_06420 [Nesidiocoris tenuis]|uniref:Uncharacterized protein n=1 Tax=Nesidiocoris tenuis TaxID=355587 RepID=A0ABN7AMZ7_9HEMI|nr:Hypothetical protein NTJ_06420 [Nesidiocoris tenuis]
MKVLEVSLWLLTCLPATLLMPAMTPPPSGGSNSNNDHDQVQLTADTLSCLRDSNITVEEVQNTTFFNAKIKISRQAMCFAACLISTDYNVSISSDGILKQEGILLQALMEGMDKTNATDVLDICKKVVSPDEVVCANIYNYASCVNQVYFEKKGIKALGNILDQDDKMGSHSYQTENPSHP